MKLMLVPTVFLTLFFLQTFDAYGHLVCQSERDDVTAAERPYDHASQNLRAINAEIAFLNIQKIDEKDSLKRHSLDIEIVMKERKRDNELEPAKNRALNNLNSARRARDRCIANDTRDCLGSCSKLHTQSVTSCECNCARWVSPSYRGCDCGPCSADLN